MALKNMIILFILCFIETLSGNIMYVNMIALL